MRSKVIFLLLPVITCASITFHMKASDSEAKAYINHEGSDVSIINDEDRKAFQITNLPLKHLVEIYSGGKPVDVFVKSPTPWNDLYTTYNWTQIQRKLNVKKIKIVKISTHVETVKSTGHVKNNGTNIFNFKSDIRADVDNVIKSSWMRNNNTNVNITSKMMYNIDMDLGISPSRHMNFISDFGKDGFAKQSGILAPVGVINFNVKPGDSVEAVLNATKVTMEGEIEYEASLNGDIAVNYFPKFKGHHFWAYDVNSVLEKTGADSVVHGTEKLTIDYYKGGTVYVTNIKTGEIMMTEPADYIN